MKGFFKWLGLGKETEPAPAGLGNTPNQNQAAVADVPVESASKSFLPARTNESLMDNLRKKARKMMEFGNVGTCVIDGSWWNELANRPVDVPMYAALNGVPVIIALISRQSLPDPDLLQETLGSRSPSLYCQAFLDGGYPILRMLFVFPDDPTKPLILEAPLKIDDGDIQDFYDALMSAKSLDLIIAHESMRDEKGYLAVSCSVSTSLQDLLRREMGKVVTAYKDGKGALSFDVARDRMYETFASPNHGWSSSAKIAIEPTGEATHKAVTFKEMSIPRPAEI